MLRTDELERLSRFEAGELTELEANQVREALAQSEELRLAHRRLVRLNAVLGEAGGWEDASVPREEGLNAALGALAASGSATTEDDALIAGILESARSPQPAPAPGDDAPIARALTSAAPTQRSSASADAPLISRALASERPPRRSSRRWVPLLVAAGVGALVTAAALLQLGGPGEVGAPALRAEQVQPVVGPEASTPAMASLGPAGEEAAVRMRLPLPNGVIEAAPKTEIGMRPDGTVVLHSGTALVQAEHAPLVVGGVLMDVEGQALITTEGAQALARATEAAPDTAPALLAGFQRVIANWQGSPAAALPLSGHIRLRSKSGESVTMARGNAWHMLPGTLPPAETAQALEGAPQKGGGLTLRQELDRRSAKVTDGELDLAGVHKTMISATAELARCFEAGLAQTPQLGGLLTLQLTVVSRGGKGALSEATVKEDYSLQNPLVVSCFLQKLSALSWPAPKGERATVEYPLALEARGTSATAGTSVFYPREATPEAPAMVVHNPDRAARQDVTAGDAPSLGGAGAQVEVVVFSDFECSFCLKAFPALDALSKKYGSTIRVAFKHKPLPSHPGARVSAAAVIAAGEQGRFWEFARLLVDNPGTRGRPEMERFAAKLGLDLLRFREAMDSERVAARIDADIAEGDRVGARGIPDFFINGREIVGVRPIEQYEKVIDEELARAGAR